MVSWFARNAAEAMENMNNNMKITKLSTKELEEELAIRKARAEAEQAPKPIPNPNFNSVRNLCIDHVKNLANGGSHEDSTQYIYEAAMECIFGRSVWDWVNKKI